MGKRKSLTLTAEEYSSAEACSRKLEKNIIVWAKEFIANNYSLDLNIPIQFRMNADSDTMGSLQVDSSTNESLRIIVNRSVLIAEAVIKDGYLHSVLKHELIHYALKELGREYKDGDDDFENELLKHDSLSSAEGGKGASLNSRKIKEILFTRVESTGEVISRQEVPMKSKRKEEKKLIMHNGEFAVGVTRREEVVLYV